MRSKTDRLLKIMHVVSWMVFVGLLIKAGTIFVNYIIGFYNTEVTKNMFGGLDLSAYKEHSLFQYSLIVFYKIVLFTIEAYVALLIAKLLGGLDLKNPFNYTVQNLMNKISQSILILWFIAIIHNAHVQYLAGKYQFPEDLFSSDFIILAGVIFIFARIVKRGIEIQSENDLTI